MINRVLLLAPLFSLAACGRTTSWSELWDPEPVQVADLGRFEDASPTPDVPLVAPETGLQPAPSIRTPQRSMEMNQLYCELENGHLVQAALRAAACLDISAAGILDDAARGFVPGELVNYGYAPATFGGCEFLVCLSNAVSCDEAQACDDARRSGDCDFGRRCSGDTLQQCNWTGEENAWLDVMECERIGGTCAEDGCQGANCTPWATCRTGDAVDFCEPYGRCAGDRIVRCLEGYDVLPSNEVVIECDELVAGGTCIEVPVGGEFPGPSCSSPTPECFPAFGEGFQCDGTEMSLCLFGEIIEVDCQNYGYNGCEDDGFFGVRCF